MSGEGTCCDEDCLLFRFFHEGFKLCLGFGFEWRLPMAQCFVGVR